MGETATSHTCSPWLLSPRRTWPLSGLERQDSEPRSGHPEGRTSSSGPPRHKGVWRRGTVCGCACVSTLIDAHTHRRDGDSGRAGGQEGRAQSATAQRGVGRAGRIRSVAPSPTQLASHLNLPGHTPIADSHPAKDI